MFRMRFTPVVALVALLTLRTSPGLAQARAGDGPDASASTDGVSELDSDIAARDSTRAVLAEDEARIQVDQVRLDSLESSLTDTREAAPHDADATAWASIASTIVRGLFRSRMRNAMSSQGIPALKGDGRKQNPLKCTIMHNGRLLVDPKPTA